MSDPSPVPWTQAHPDLDTSSMEIVGPLKGASAALEALTPGQREEIVKALGTLVEVLRAAAQRGGRTSDPFVQ